ncbi:recombinase family protein [Thermanaeromonas sp. C210]|uniref:recombinase family protein n=1 Tax=Thermanaeromonas sp. C210 TaxID=2731925 RepID=UPI00155BCB2A|nr:recombinase family protein [Thermanaeromonas sp. C210]GFN23283.1 resolvase-like protein [Thermanaeromonas sp. C210]
MSRAIVYARVSTQDQALGFSLASQKELGEKKARELGATEIEIVEDAYTGTELDRPALNYLRRQVAEGRVHLVVVYDPDRLSRDLADLLLLCREFEAAGVRLEFVNFDWQRTPQGILFLQLRGAFAQFEHALIKERTQRGKAKKAAGGKIRCYAKPFGYDWDAENDTLVINPREAEIVKQMFDWVTDPLMPLTPWQVTQRLAFLYPPGPRGKGWIYSTVLRILKNPVYTGRLVRKDERPEWKPVLVPAIISPATFARAQETLARCKRFNPKATRRQFLLQRLLICGECGRTLAVYTHRSSGKGEYSYYTCPRRYPRKAGARGQGGCALPPWNTGELDAAVWQTVASLLADPDVIQQYITPEPSTRQQIARRLAEVRQRVERTKGVLERIDRAYLVLETLAEEDYRRYRREAERVRREAEEELARLERLSQNETASSSGGAGSVRRHAEGLAASIAHLDFATRQAVLRELIRQIRVYADGRVEVEGYFPAPLKFSPVCYKADIEKKAIQKLLKEFQTEKS